MGSCGTTANALAFGGNTGSPTTATEEWTGSGAPVGAWATANNLNTARQAMGGCGIATAALAAGGETPAPATPTNSFEYDGTSFTASGALIEATVNAGAGGIQTAALTFGKSNNSRPTAVQGYDGTSFSTRPSIATGRAQMASGKNASTAELTWMAGGYTTTVVANTEEFTGETTAANIKTFSTS